MFPFVNVLNDKVYKDNVISSCFLSLSDETSN